MVFYSNSLYKAVHLTLAVKLLCCECHRTPLVRSHQAPAWANTDPDLSPHGVPKSQWVNTKNAWMPVKHNVIWSGFSPFPFYKNSRRHIVIKIMSYGERSNIDTCYHGKISYILLPSACNFQHNQIANNSPCGIWLNKWWYRTFIHVCQNGLQCFLPIVCFSIHPIFIQYVYPFPVCWVYEYSYLISSSPS